MMVTICSTSRVVELVAANGARVPARVWEGETSGGTPVTLFVTRVAAARGADLAELEAALAETGPPRVVGRLAL